MSRSIKKGPFADASLLKKTEAQEGSGKKQVIKIWFHRSATFPSFVGFTIAIYDRRRHVPVYITEDMADHKLGEFVPTGTFRGHKVADKATTTVGKQQEGKTPK